MANLQGYSYNRVLSGSPDWTHTINYRETARNASSVTYEVTIGLRLTEGSYGYRARANVTVNGATSSWVEYSNGTSWSRNTTYTIKTTVKANASSTSGNLSATVRWEGISASSPTFSVSGEFSTSNFNTPPYFPAGTKLIIKNGSSSGSELTGIIPENVSTLYCDWGAASDGEGGTLTYILQQQVNGGGWATIDTGTDRAHSFYIGSGNEGESRRFWVTVRDNQGVQADTGVYSATITKNKLTGGWFTGSSNNIYFGTESFTLSYTGGSNTNGSKVEYYVYSDDVTIHNSSVTTATSLTIKIWKSGAYPTGPYIKFEDIKNKFRNSDYAGNLHLGLRTSNGYGTNRWSSGSVWTNLKTDAIPPSKVTITGGTALRAVTGASKGNLYLPDGNRTINFSWDGGGNPLGDGFTYRLYQILDGTVTHITDVSSSTKSYSVILPRQFKKRRLAFGVHTITNYGWGQGLDSGAVDIHYYNSPTLIANSVSRTATTATVKITIKSDSSITGIKTVGHWECQNTGIMSITPMSENPNDILNETQGEQTLNISPLFGEYQHIVHVTFKDDTGLCDFVTQSIKIPSHQPIMLLNKYGVGIGGEEASASAALKVKGISQGNAFINTGFESSSSGSDRTGWWTKVCSLKVTGQFGDASAILKYLDWGSGSEAPVTGEVTARLKQQNPMGQAPAYTLYLTNYVTLGLDNFRLIITSNTASLTEAQLWVKMSQGYTTINFAPIFKIGNFEMNKSPIAQQNPPAGEYKIPRKIVNLGASDVGAVSTAGGSMSQNLNFSNDKGLYWYANGDGAGMFFHGDTTSNKSYLRLYVKDDWDESIQFGGEHYSEGFAQWAKIDKGGIQANRFAIQSTTDVVNNAPWYGLGMTNTTMGGSGNVVQLAGHWGVRIRSNSNMLDLGYNSGGMVYYNSNGSFTVGPRNTSWCHMDTDRAGFYVYKPTTFDSDVSINRSCSVGNHSSTAFLGFDARRSTGSGTKTTARFGAFNYAGGAAGMEVFHDGVSKNAVILDYDSFYPNETNKVFLGINACKWKQVWAISGTIQTSDRDLKTDIEYITDPSEKIETYMHGTSEASKYHDFIKNMKFASWKWKENNDDNLDNIGFIAQDIIDTEIGDKILYNDGEGDIGYSTSNYITAVAIALQEEIIVKDIAIANLENKVGQLEEKINMILESNKEPINE